MSKRDATFFLELVLSELESLSGCFSLGHPRLPIGERTNLRQFLSHQLKACLSLCSLSFNW